MKRYVFNIIAACSLALLLSCGDKKQEDASPPHQIPAALQEKTPALSSIKRSSGDMTENLYQELAESRQELKQLENDLYTLRNDPGTAMEAFHTYNNKSGNYYTSAQFRAEGIRDSILKQTMLRLIVQSSERYTKKTAPLQALLQKISENRLSISDHYAALKIAVTLPMMETYQAGELPDGKDLKALIKTQELLLKELKKLIPKTSLQQ